MASDRPVTEEEIEALREDIEALREEVREDLAEDLGGDPEEYDATRRPVADGGD